MDNYIKNPVLLAGQLFQSLLLKRELMSIINPLLIDQMKRVPT